MPRPLRGTHETLWLTEWGADGRSTFPLQRMKARTRIATSGLLQFVIAIDDKRVTGNLRATESREKEDVD
jgi:hypothetical protein